MVTGIFNHLWQSTLFAAAVIAAVTALRRNSPRLRYWLWLGASAKFLIPFSLLVSMGTWVQFPPDAPSLRATTVTRISTYFAPIPAATHAAHAAAATHWPLVFAAIWLAGALGLVFRWLHNWRKIRIAARAAVRLPLLHDVPVFSSPVMMEPGIFGIIRPVLLLPRGIMETLTPGQFDAILAHERRHLQCRDNLTAAVHMCVETLFWFHPLVWWIGARLMEERERDCDEAVLNQGSRPRDYAQGIVNVCRSYAESPLPCTSGITSADLKKRIREIMDWRGSQPFTLRGKVAITVAGLAALAVPLVIGVLRAQTLPPAPAYTYEVVSIHPSAAGQTNSRIGPGPQGGIRTENTSVMQLLTFAYDVRGFQFVDVPGWVSSDHFDVSFTPDKGENLPGPGVAQSERDALFSRTRQRMQAVLRDRFGLVLRAELRTMPIYTLGAVRSGHKLKAGDAQLFPSMHVENGRMNASSATLKMLTDFLAGEVDRPVVDETGLDGPYDFQLEWSSDVPPDPANGNAANAAGGPSLVTALTEQLGLRLESKKGPAQVYVIEKIEKPGQN